MSHIPEGELVLYATRPAAVDAARCAEIEAHLGACAECQETHDFFSVHEQGEVDEALGEADTWEPMVASATYDALMEYGERVAEEDREAEAILAPYLQHAIRAAWNAMTTKRRFRTGGVVRKLNAAAHAVHKDKPLDALTFADAAISVAEVLPDDHYPARAVYQLRGAAWKERAKAQLILGEFPQAHDSLDHAERAYRNTPHNALSLSLVALLRAGVFYEQGRLDEAMAVAERAESGFAHAGDEKRRMDAAFLRVTSSSTAKIRQTQNGSRSDLTRLRIARWIATISVKRASYSTGRSGRSASAVPSANESWPSGVLLGSCSTAGSFRKQSGGCVVLLRISNEWGWQQTPPLSA